MVAVIFKKRTRNTKINFLTCIFMIFKTKLNCKLYYFKRKKIEGIFQNLNNNYLLTKDKNSYFVGISGEPLKMFRPVLFTRCHDEPLIPRCFLFFLHEDLSLLILILAYLLPVSIFVLFVITLHSFGCYFHIYPYRNLPILYFRIN